MGAKSGADSKTVVEPACVPTDHKVLLMVAVILESKDALEQNPTFLAATSKPRAGMRLADAAQWYAVSARHRFVKIPANITRRHGIDQSSACGVRVIGSLERKQKRCGA